MRPDDASPFAPAAGYDLAGARPDHTRESGYGPTCEAAEAALADLAPAVAAAHGLTPAQVQAAFDVLGWVWQPECFPDGDRQHDRRYSRLPARPAATPALFGEEEPADEDDEYDRHDPRFRAVVLPLSAELECEAETATALVQVFRETVFPVAFLGRPDDRERVRLGPDPDQREHTATAADPALRASRSHFGDD